MKPHGGSAPPDAALRRGFEEFHEAQYKKLVKVVMVLTGSLHDAEDVVSEVMIELWKDWPRVMREKGEFLDRYARKAVVNRTISMMRREGKWLPRVLKGGHLVVEDQQDGMTAWEERQWVDQMLAALPRAQREVMTLIFEELTVAEISNVLGKTKQNVRQNLCHARKKLKTQLGQDYQVSCGTESSPLIAVVREEVNGE